MDNTDVRTLRIFEFNRALSYVSEILENLREEELLSRERRNLSKEKDEWEDELTSLPDNKKKAERETILEFMDNIDSRIDEICEKLRQLDKYADELKLLVAKILEYVLDEDLYLTGDEIQKSFVEEYIYILTEIENDGDYFNIDSIFEEKGDLIILVCETYGYEQKQLICDITNTDDYIRGTFDDYFNLI